MNRGVIVTGGSRGIGEAIVRAFSGAGDRVAFLYRQEDERAKSVAHACGAVAIRADVSSEQDVRAAFDEARRSIGDIDVLINNAGVAHFGLLTDMTTEEWNRLVGTDLTGTFLCCREILPGMIHKKQGCIINIASMWGEVGASCEVAYSACKAGVIGLTKALAKEVGPSGIRVNCVSPGVIDTEMNRVFDRETMDALRDETPLSAIGKASDVADACLFLAGDGAKFVTGQVLGVNGGFCIT